MQVAYALPNELTIYTVGELRSQCMAWMGAATDEANEPSVLRLEAQGVTDVDAAGVQLLLSLANSLQPRNWQLQFMAPSQALSDACHALGATSLMHNTATEECAS